MINAKEAYKRTKEVRNKESNIEELLKKVEIEITEAIEKGKFHARYTLSTKQEDFDAPEVIKILRKKGFKADREVFTFAKLIEISWGKER